MVEGLAVVAGIAEFSARRIRLSNRFPVLD
jgi:hypothetical protein